MLTLAVDFLALNTDFVRSLDAQPDNAARNADYCNGNAIANDNSFTWFAT